jgi:hypothetical protein
MDPQEHELRARCDRLSLRVQNLSLCLVLGEILFVFWVAVRPASAAQTSLLLPLVLIVIVWLMLQRMNHQLVSCGMQQFRYTLSPRHINRPEFAVRMAYHLIINWSAIPLILLAASASRPSSESRYLAYLAMAATILVWLAFNLLHRRMNRARNLLSTTLIAAALLIGSLIVAT